MSKTRRGWLITILGASFWGFSGACGQFLFTNYQIDASWLSALRMLAAGLLLLIYSLAKYPRELRSLVGTRENLLPLVLFAIPGMMMVQFTYLKAISYTNAGTATVLQYLMPVLILCYVCCASRRKPVRRELVAITLALLGTFLLATHGNIGHLVINEAGLFWGLSSAVAAALYSLLPRKLMARYGSIPVIACGMLLGGIVISIPAHFWSYFPALDLAGNLALAGIVIIGTVLGFSFYLQGVLDVGAVTASMLASMEPLAATLLAVFWLGSDIGPIDLLGFACIIATVFILAEKN